MKIYLIKHKDYKTLPSNLEAWSKVDQISNGESQGIYIKAVHAFLKKKDAQAYLDSLPERVSQYREIVPFESVN